MHFMSRVFSNTTSLMTSVCMLYVGAMESSSYLSQYAAKLLKGENQSTWSEVKFKVTVTKIVMRHSAIPRCIHTPNLEFLSPIIYKICSRHDYSKNEIRVQGHSDATHRHPLTHSHQFGIFTPNNIGDILQT